MTPNRLFSLAARLWFQGDSNQFHPSEYGELFQAMIREWREEWGDPKLPFHFVELNNCQTKQTQSVENSPLCLIREQQHAGLLLPNVRIVCSIDLGSGNPHFPDKKPVGVRLAGLALRDCYGQPGLVDSPLFKSLSVEGDRIRLRFSDAEALRVRDGGDLKGFAIRGDSGRWAWAVGRIEGSDIVVWNDAIAGPAAVRYGWAANPVTSVENGAGLPLPRCGRTRPVPSEGHSDAP
jgi:sialate O-acetylesterase